MQKRKAIALLSGGLDSALAARIILNQGIDILGLYLSSPFGCHEDVEKVATGLGIPLKMVEKDSAYIDLVRNPKYGYGKNMNPCIDCRIYMFILARRVMEEEGADFIITGEVLGQRPMSQRRDAMHTIDRDSDMEDLILRPLCAKLLEPTRPEREGWVDRDHLLDLSGRGRTEQLALAEQFHLSGYTAPAGGCLLTDPNFSEKLALFFKMRAQPTMTETRLLRYGRFFNLDHETFVLLGRNEDENEKLEILSQNEVEQGHLALLKPVFTGPTAVLSGTFSDTVFNDVSHLITRYSKKGGDSERAIDMTYGKIQKRFLVSSFSELPVVAL